MTLEIEAGLTRQGFGSGCVSASSLFYHLWSPPVPHNFQMTFKGSLNNEVTEVPTPEVQPGIQVPPFPGSPPWFMQLITASNPDILSVLVPSETQIYHYIIATHIYVFSLLWGFKLHEGRGFVVPAPCWAQGLFPRTHSRGGVQWKCAWLPCWATFTLSR